MIGWIAIAITVAIFAAIAIRIDDWGRDWSENFAELDVDAERSELRPLTLQGPIESLVKRLDDWTTQRGQWELVSSTIYERPLEDGTLATSKLTRRTAVFRFVDDIEVRFVQEGDGSQITLYASSQARVGKGDLGQNPRNLIELKGCFDEQAN
ncbi:MAG: DUF1499 domain-containing protein [Planctomycetota bacterium]